MFFERFPTWTDNISSYIGNSKDVFLKTNRK